MTVQDAGSITREEALVTVDDVSIGYSEKVAVEKVDLSVQPGEFVSIIGPSGCGKSTLLHLLSGLNEPLRGRVSVRGVDSTGSMGGALKVGYVFQDHRLLPWRTVAQNLDIAMKNAAVPQEEWAQRRSRYLSLLRVADHEGSFPLRLSGGQRQRVSIARAMAVSPDIVLMDEPFSGLDEVTARSIRRELDASRQRQDPATVFVTHSIREALYLSDRVVMLSRGPAHVIKEIVVDIPRPRAYDDETIVDLEKTIVDEVLEQWEDTAVTAPAGGTA